MPRSAIATTLAEARGSLDEIGLPAIVRPPSPSAARRRHRPHAEEYERIVERGLAASPIGRC
jgi:carbamoyl-phosphate synthase large subunit